MNAVVAFYKVTIMRITAPSFKMKKTKSFKQETNQLLNLIVKQCIFKLKMSLTTISSYFRVYKVIFNNKLFIVLFQFFKILRKGVYKDKNAIKLSEYAN